MADGLMSALMMVQEAASASQVREQQANQHCAQAAEAKRCLLL